MEDHFNENYMESDHFKIAMFKGGIVEEVDYAINGEYAVTAKGILTIHGVSKNRLIKVKIIIKSGKIQLITNFDIKLADHNIDIPKVVTQKIAEAVDVKVSANFEKK